MDTRERLRLRMTREVLRLVRVRDFRAALPPQSDGVSNVVIGFLDDSIKDVLDQINLIGGGSSHVVVPPADLNDWPNGIALLQVLKSDRVVPPEQMTEDDCPVKPESQIGMLLELLKMRRGRSMTFHICRRETTVELVDDGKEVVPV